MKLSEESSNLKNFIEITPKNKPIKNSNSLSSVLFPRTINLEKNDYFKDFGLKKKIILLVLFYHLMKKQIIH